MPQSKDCVNTKTKFGQNLTPLELIHTVRSIFGSGIDLDPASDAIANEYVKAAEFYTLEQDGYSRPWKAKNVWLNPPGRSRTHDGKFITASDWAKKLFMAYLQGDVENAMYLAYRGGSVGSLGVNFMSESLMCLTAAGSENVNGSGRFAYLVFNGEELIPEPSNTQSSAIFLLSQDPGIRSRFVSLMKIYGAVFTPTSHHASEETLLPDLQ